MDEKELGLPEFSLEDILREFSDDPENITPEPEAPEEAPAEVPAEELSVEEAAPAADTAPDGDTRRLEDTVRIDDTIRLEDTVRIDDAVRMDDTIRLDKLPGREEPGPQLGDTQKFQPITDENEAPTEEEPFSENWEPEYDQPMGEYVPPQPIIFRPRSRLRELKRKLIEGPEKRYYELTEIGVGKLQAAIFLSLLVVAFSAGATVLYAMGMVQESRLKLMVFGQFLAMLLSALLGCYQMMEGISDLFHKKFTLNTLLVFTFAACCVDGVLGLQELRVPCCAAFGLQVTMSLWSAYHKRITEMGQMDTMRKATRLDSVSAVADYYEGRPGIQRGEGQVEDFMDTYNETSGPEKAVSCYALIVLILSVLIGVAAGILHGVSAGFQVLAVSLLAAVPATFFVTLSRPGAILERRLHRLGTVLCGWQGVKGLSRKMVFPLEHNDLFPAGTAKMNGVKFYGSRDPDQIVAYAAALIEADGCGLAPLFDQLLDSRNGRHYDVEYFQIYNGGIGGEVCGEPVLVGGLSFMKDVGVDVPEGIRVNQAVYVAVDGELCGLFAITYEKDRGAAAGMATLCSYRDLKPVLISGDFMLTESLIRSKFGVNTRRMAFPERAVREELRAVPPDTDAPALALTTRDGLAGAAFAVTGARSLRTACRLGMVVHMLAGSVGLLMMLALTILGELSLLTPANLFLYELVWMIPGLLITEWTRSV